MRFHEKVSSLCCLNIKVSYGVGELRGWWYGGFAFSMVRKSNGNYEQRNEEKR